MQSQLKGDDALEKTSCLLLPLLINTPNSVDYIRDPNQYNNLFSFFVFIEKTNKKGMSNFEFTPIGYVKSKQGVNDPRETAMSPTMNSTERSPRHIGKAQRRSIDDTVNSSRVQDENDTFDDTLPELEVRKISQYRRFANRMSPKVRDENRGTGNSSNNNNSNDGAEVSDILSKTSNPIKDQEKKIKDLEHENTVLKVKNVSYRSLLANYSNTPGNQNNLNLIEEVSTWKTKYLETNEKLIKLKQDYEDYMQRIENSKDTTNNLETNVLPIDNPEYIKERESILEELEKVTNDFKDLRNRYNDIEERYTSLQQELNNERKEKKYQEDQYSNQIEDLQSELDDKVKNIAEHEKKINSLEAQLESIGTQSGSQTQGLLQELKQKDKNITELQDNIEEKTRDINKLTHDISEKEDQLKQTEAKYKSVQDEYESYKNQVQNKLSSSQNDQSTSTRQLEELKFVKDKLEKEVKELKSQVKNLESDLKSSEAKNKESKDELERIHDQNRKQEHQQSERLNAISSKLSATERELHEANKLIENLKKELSETKQELERSTKTIKELHHEIIQNATKSKEQINGKLEEKDSEISALKQEIETLDVKLFETKAELDRINSTTEEDHKAEIRRLKNSFELEKESIERQLKHLTTERERLEDIHKMEIQSWERKYDILKRENDRILSQEKNETRSMDQYIKEKNDRIKELNETLTTLQNDKNDLEAQVDSMRQSKDHYKADLKDALATIDRLRIEMNSIKEMKFTGAGSGTAVEKKYNKLKDEFKLMKKGYLDEMIKLQNRNRELNTELQKRMGPVPSSSQGLVRDKLDYYKLKYNNEVRQNNDLKVINEYLNRVLRASAQDIRLNLLKVENDLNMDIQDRKDPLVGKPYSRSSGGSRNSDNDYHTTQYKRYRFRTLRFKTVALAVLSIVRMHRAGRKHNWDEQRIRYLQRKIITEEDRITW